MMEWLESLGVLGQIYFWVAIAASVLLVVQIIIMLFSFGGGDAEIDVDGDGLLDGGDMDASGISIFTVKGLTSFFTLGAWVGLLCFVTFPENLQTLSLLPAFICGAAAMVGMAFAMRAMLKLQESGNLQKESLVGKTATVYISVQPNRTGRGKITLTAQGQYMELDAVTDESEKLCADEKVFIKEYSNGIALVERIKE